MEEADEVMGHGHKIVVSGLGKNVPICDKFVRFMEYHPNNSTTINLIILQGLVMQIPKKRDLQLEDFKRNHLGGHIGQILSGDRKR